MVMFDVLMWGIVVGCSGYGEESGGGGDDIHGGGPFKWPIVPRTFPQ